MAQVSKPSVRAMRLVSLKSGEQFGILLTVSKPSVRAMRLVRGYFGIVASDVERFQSPRCGR